MRILIVEDDGGSRGILLEHLKVRGWEVLSCGDPARGLRLLESEQPDLVLTDIHLPGATGTDHVRAFCQERAGRRPVVVAMTGYPALESCLDCLQAGASGYLVKPFRVDEFIQLAERVLDERRLLGHARSLELRIAELEAELARLRAPGSPPTGRPEQESPCH
jgi:DNA-binding response OmpR family regulator